MHFLSFSGLLTLQYMQQKKKIFPYPESLTSLDSFLAREEIQIFPIVQTQTCFLRMDKNALTTICGLCISHRIVPTLFLYAHVQSSQSLLQSVCKTRPSALGVPSWPSHTAAQACRRMRPLTRHCMLKSQWVWLFLLREAS